MPGNTSLPTVDGISVARYIFSAILFYLNLVSGSGKDIGEILWSVVT